MSLATCILTSLLVKTLYISSARHLNFSVPVNFFVGIFTPTLEFDLGFVLMTSLLISSLVLFYSGENNLLLHICTFNYHLFALCITFVGMFQT